MFLLISVLHWHNIEFWFVRLHCMPYHPSYRCFIQFCRNTNQTKKEPLERSEGEVNDSSDSIPLTAIDLPLVSLSLWHCIDIYQPKLCNSHSVKFIFTPTHFVVWIIVVYSSSLNFCSFFVFVCPTSILFSLVDFFSPYHERW